MRTFPHIGRARAGQGSSSPDWAGAPACCRLRPFGPLKPATCRRSGPSVLRAEHGLWGLALALALPAHSAWACAACYGQSDSPLAAGMNWGIFSLLGTIIVVLGGVAAFFVFLARRSAGARAATLAGPALPRAEASAPLVGRHPIPSRLPGWARGSSAPGSRRVCSHAHGDLRSRSVLDMRRH